MSAAISETLFLKGSAVHFISRNRKYSEKQYEYSNTYCYFYSAAFFLFHIFLRLKTSIKLSKTLNMDRSAEIIIAAGIISTAKNPSPIKPKNFSIALFPAADYLVIAARGYEINRCVEDTEQHKTA